MTESSNNVDRKEGFRPVVNLGPATPLGSLYFFGRMLLDFQIRTIVLDLKREIPNFGGVVLDVGCGSSPYRYLLNSEATGYVGVDTNKADDFGYTNSRLVTFGGSSLPFLDGVFDAFICTEVLEHVLDHQSLVDEIYRVMKKGARGVVTVPWSARFHYIPDDYFRYTPSALQHIFSKFRKVTITNRGTDLNVIMSKIIVFFARESRLHTLKGLFVTLTLIALSPILILLLLFAHIELFSKFGSSDDPLGYTIMVEK